MDPHWASVDCGTVVGVVDFDGNYLCVVVGVDFVFDDYLRWERCFEAAAAVAASE